MTIVLGLAALACEPSVGPLDAADLPGEQAFLATHYEGYHTRLEQHRTPAGDHCAVLVTFPGAAKPDPVVYIVDGARIVSRNAAPFSGFDGYKYLHRIAADAAGRALVAWHGTSPRGVHARLVDGDKPVWTVTLQPETSHISSVNAARLGGDFVVAVSEEERVVLYGIGETGAVTWTRTVSTSPSFHNPVALAVHPADGLYALWYERDQAFRGARVVAGGRVVWNERIGPAPSFAMTVPRPIQLELLPGGGFEAELYEGMDGDGIRDVREYAAVVTPTGSVTLKR